MEEPEILLFSAAAAAVGEGTESFGLLKRLMGGAAPEHVDMLLEQVDGSDYSLADWIAALGEFDAWMERMGRAERPIGQMLGYIHCCTLMQSPGLSSPMLKVIVYQALTEFGFEAISDAQI